MTASDASGYGWTGSLNPKGQMAKQKRIYSGVSDYDMEVLSNREDVLHAERMDGLLDGALTGVAINSTLNPHDRGWIGDAPNGSHDLVGLLQHLAGEAVSK